MINLKNTDNDVSNINLLNVVEYTGVSLTNCGRYYQALCPFHDDKDTPSLTIYPETNSFFCFGCRETGDVISWVMKIRNLNFVQAREWLITNFSCKPTEYVPKLPKRKEKKVNPDLVLYWSGLLKKSGIDYFEKRGFTEKTIQEQMLGYDGERLVIPVWEGKPQYSECLGVRLRKLNGSGPKYKGLKNHNPPTVYNKYYCQKDIALCFAGELDSLRAVQDGLSSFSLVNGMNSFSRFPKDWPQLWFPKVKSLVVVFDRKEEHIAGKVARDWNRTKGARSASVFQWPILEKDPKDYCEFRDVGFNVKLFKELIQDQLSMGI